VEERGVNLAGIELALELTEGLQRVREVLEAEGESREARRLRPLVEHLLRLLGAEDSSVGDADRVAERAR
jgi:hypothetical protein